MCEASKSKLEAALVASERKLFDVQQGVQQLELIKDSAGQLATIVDEAEKTLVASKKPVQCLEDQVAEQSSQLLTENAETTSEHERVSKTEGQVTSL